MTRWTWQLVSLCVLINFGGFSREMAYRNVRGRGVWNRGGRGGSCRSADKYVRSDTVLDLKQRVISVERVLRSNTDRLKLSEYRSIDLEARIRRKTYCFKGFRRKDKRIASRRSGT